MAKRDPELRRRQREAELRRHLLIGGGAIIAILLVILLLISLKARSTRVNEIKSVDGTAAAVENQTTGSGALSAPSEQNDPGLEAMSDVVSAAEVPTAAPTPTPKPVVTEPSIDADGTVHFMNDPSYSQSITILGTGDNLIHEALIKCAETDDGYDFKPLYAKVKKFIEPVDIATVNQETPIATSIGSASGYPYFNTPTEDGDALIDLGFDAFNLATNHVYDMGASGLEATIEYFENQGKIYFGAYYDADDRYYIRTKEVNGIKVAFLGFVNYTNHETDNMGNQLIWLDDYESVKSQITRAREQADIVVVYAHWGEEYENVITDEMAQQAQYMVNCGADIIFGDHTHILQKLTVLTRESDGALCPVQYCGGNFISGQKNRASLLSCLTNVQVSKNPETGKAVVTGLKALPIVTHYLGDRKELSLYPLDDYTEELANAHGVKEVEDGEGIMMTMDYMWGLAHAEIADQFMIHTSDYDDGDIFN